MTYKKTIQDNKLTLENTGSVPLSIKISADEYCCGQCAEDCIDCSYKVLYDITVQAGETKKYSLTDGSYIVSVSDGVTTENVKLRVLLALRTDIVKEYFTAFCSNCECSGTTQKYVSEDYKNLLKEPIVIQSVITYSLMKDYLSKKSFTDYLQGAFEKYRCSITYNDCSQRSSIKFYGKYNHEFDLFGKLASIYMVGFYLMDIAEGTDTIVNEVYRICELKRCINKFGLVYEDLSDIFYNGAPAPPIDEEPGGGENPPADTPTIYYGFSDAIPTTHEEVIAQGSTQSLSFTTNEITKNSNFIAFPTTMQLISVENGYFSGDFWYGNGNDIYLSKTTMTINSKTYNVYTMTTLAPIGATGKVILANI